MDKARFYVSDQKHFIDKDGSYFSVSIHIPSYYYLIESIAPWETREQVIQKAKKELINKLLADLMETEDWFEEDRN